MAAPGNPSAGGTADPAALRTVVLLAGASGSGKSRLAAAAGCPRLNLDDFYHDGDHPDLPHALGIVDWDDPRSWNQEAAVAALVSLSRTGAADVPVYDISLNRRCDHRLLDLGPSPAVVAEGVFAPEVVAALRSAGVPLEALYLDRSRTATSLRRFLRDVLERRKPVGVLLRRGVALWRAEPAIRAQALRLGCRPVSMEAARHTVQAARRPRSLPG